MSSTPFTFDLLLSLIFRSKQNKAYSLKVGSETIAVFCHMTSLGACGGGGWTLVIKMNGFQVCAGFKRGYFWSFTCQLQAA